MTEKYFPALNEKNMKVVAQLYSEDSEYFDDPICPYSEETKDIFKAANPASDYFDVDGGELINISEFDEDRLLKEVGALWGLLQDQKDMAKSETASERNTYFRMSTALLEKVVSLREKCMNLKKMHEFSDAVLEAMDEYLDAEQRTAVMEKLKKILEGE